MIVDADDKAQQHPGSVCREQERLVSLTTHDEKGSVVNNLASYQKHSRLHFIGGWRYRAEEVVREWLAFPSEKEAATHHFDVFPWAHAFYLMTQQRVSLGRNACTVDGHSRGASSRPVFVHVDMDAFFCSVALSRDEYAAVREFPVAAAVGTGNSEITSCNYAARAHGVTAGMFVGEVRRTICPQLRVVPYDMDQCAAYAEHAYKLMFAFIPFIHSETWEVRFGTAKSRSLMSAETTSALGLGLPLFLREDELVVSTWLALDVVVEIISVDDTMISFAWPSSFSNAMASRGAKSAATRHVRLPGGVSVPVSPETSAVDLEAALYAICVSYAAILRGSVTHGCGGISATCGIGPSYLACRLATGRAKPNGTCVVLPTEAFRLAPELSFQRLLGQERCIEEEEHHTCASHIFWVDLVGKEKLANQFVPHVAWHVADASALMAPSQFSVLEDKLFIDSTKVCELFGVGRKLLQRLVAVFKETVSRLSAVRRDAPKAEAPNRVQTLLSFNRKKEPREKAVLEVTLKRSTSSTRQGLEDDLCACLVVAGGPASLPSEVTVGSFGEDDRDDRGRRLNCAMLRLVPLGVLQEALGRKMGVLLYCFCRGIDLRVLAQTGLSDLVFPAVGTDMNYRRGADAGGNEPDCEPLRAFDASVTYLTEMYFSRDESAPSAVSTAMGYACRPKHIRDIQNIIKQLLEDVMRKIILRRFSPVLGPDGRVVSQNQYEAFTSIRLTFHYRHPNYPKETTKYLGLGRCVEKVFVVRIFVEREFEDGQQLATLSSYSIQTFYSGVISAAGNEPTAADPSRRQHGEPRSKDANKRERTDEEDVGGAEEGSEEEASTGMIRSRGDEPITAHVGASIVVVVSRHATETSYDTGGDSAVPESHRNALGLKLCPQAANPPLPPESAGAVPISVKSLRLLDRSKLEGGASNVARERSVAGSPWIDLVTASLVHAVRGAFIDEWGPHLARTLVPPNGIFMQIDDIRGMSLSVTGLKTTEALAEASSCSRPQRQGETNLFLHSNVNRPSDWLLKAKRLQSSRSEATRIDQPAASRQPKDSSIRTGGRTLFDKEVNGSIRNSRSIFSVDEAVNLDATHLRAPKHHGERQNAECASGAGTMADEGCEASARLLAAFQKRLLQCLGVDLGNQSPLPLRIFTDARLPTLICRWAESRSLGQGAVEMSLFIEAYARSVESMALSNESVAVSDLVLNVQSWLRMWDLAGGKPLDPSVHERWITLLSRHEVA